jgi:hypothetical protein
MKKTITLLFAVLCSIFALFGQSSTKQTDRIEECGTEAPSAEWEYSFQKQIGSYQKQAKKGSKSTYTIPVIVHILYNGSTESQVGNGANLITGQIQSQIETLNDFFAGKDPGKSNLPPIFSAVDAGDVGIQFCMATKDENGNLLSEPGIDRIDWKAKGWIDPMSWQSDTASKRKLIDHMANTVKPQSIYDPTKYFNIWVLNMNNSGLNGYATFPAGSTLEINSSLGTDKTDGVVIKSNVFGNRIKFPNGYYSADNTRKYGGTTIHETGHWVGLRHIWGDAICGDDFCNDTPDQRTSNSGMCPTHPHNAGSCSNNQDGEMFQNYMDYTKDGCKALFTNDQKTRMMTAMQNGLYRKELGTHRLCDAIALSAQETDRAIEGMNIYPNPASKLFTLSFNAQVKGDYQIELSNAIGQVIYSERVADHQGRYAKPINTETFGKGIYLMKVNSQVGSSMQKVVIE